jgi:hypothetical protein
MKNNHNYKLKHRLKDKRHFYISHYGEKGIPVLRMKYPFNTAKTLKFWKKHANRTARQNFRQYNARKSYISDVKKSPIERSIAWFVD